MIILNKNIRYIDTDSFIVHAKTENFKKILQMMLKKVLIHQIIKLIDHCLEEKNKKVTRLMKEELDGKIMEFVVLRPKAYSYLIDDDNSDKKAKGTKKCVLKQILRFNDYKNCLLNNEIILKSQQRFANYKQNVFTEEISKVVLSSNMIIDCRLLIKLRHIPMVQMLEKYVKQSC